MYTTNKQRTIETIGQTWHCLCRLSVVVDLLVVRLGDYLLHELGQPKSGQTLQYS